MLVQEIDYVGSKALQGSFDRLADESRVTIDADNLAVADFESELGGDHDFVAMPLNSTTNQSLVSMRTVLLGGIEKRHPKIDRTTDRRETLGVVRGAIAAGHAIAAKPNRRNFQSW